MCGLRTVRGNWTLFFLVVVVQKRNRHLSSTITDHFYSDDDRKTSIIQHLGSAQHRNVHCFLSFLFLFFSFLSSKTFLLRSEFDTKREHAMLHSSVLSTSVHVSNYPSFILIVAIGQSIVPSSGLCCMCCDAAFSFNKTNNFCPLFIYK